MALSPSDALQGRTTKRMQQQQQLETRIDAALENFPDSDSCSVSVDSSVLPHTFNAVVAAYRAAGWTVEVETDFNGNRRMNFEAPAGL